MVGAGVVAGNRYSKTPALAKFALVAALPLRVKKLALTPDKVYPVFGITVTVAV